MPRQDAPYPRRWLVLPVLASSLLLIAMDATILNVALPTLASDLDPSAVELLWIVDAYGLVLAGLLVAMAGLGDRIGRRRLLTIGLAVFAAASVLAALATAPGHLIAARVLLGAGGAMIMPSTLSVLRNVFLDDRERALAVGIWSAVAAGGFALGPVVGGALLEVADWPWLFAAQVPVILLALVAARALVPESRNPDPGPCDPAGVALSIGGMAAFVWGIKTGGEHGFADARALIAMTAGLALLGLFIRRQARSSHPLVDVRLFADRRFSTSAMSVLFVFFGMAAVLLLLTQYLQLVQGFSPLASGVRLLPLALAAAVSGVLTDPIVRRTGAAAVVGSSFALVAAGIALLATLEAASGYAVLGVAFTMIGLGGGAAATAASAASLASAPPERAGGAAAVQETAFELGGALGVALLGSLMSSAYQAALGVPRGVPAEAVDVAAEGIPAATEAARVLGGPAGEALARAAETAFLDGLATTSLVAAGVMAAGALAAALLMPGRVDPHARRGTTTSGSSASAAADSY